MPLTLLPVQPQDLHILIDIYFRAFQNPLALAAFPDVPAVRQWWTASIAEEMRDPNAIFLKVVEGNQIIAWAKWNRPIANKPEEPLPQWPDGGDKELAQKFFTKLNEVHNQVMRSRPHR